jgi:hypothetical protein
LIDSCSFVLVVLAVVSHGLLQECRGGLGDDERHPPRLIVKEKVKGPQKTTTKKKHKRGDKGRESSGSSSNY